MFLTGYAAELYEILTEGEDDDLEDVPVVLEGIQDVIDKCKEAGDATVEKFNFVNKLMEECMTKSKGKKRRTEAIKAEVDRLIDAGKVERSQRQALIDKMEAQIDNLEKQEEEQRTKYMESLDSMNR